MKSDVDVVALKRLPELEGVLIEGPAPSLDGSQLVIIGFSVRNRSFKEKFFKSSFSFIDKYCKEGLVTIFDEPYAFNDAAARGSNSPTETEFQKNIRIYSLDLCLMFYLK